MEKRDYKNIIIILSIVLLSVLLVFICGYVFGANMDFINQHAVIPDYFRNYFYENHKLVPDILYNIGAGENAFNFSYYGLLNPIILVSYLLPFISMRSYVMFSSIILLFSSIILFYKWIRNHFNSKYSFFLTLIFLLTSPIFFHFHRQIMFVNYFPFLLLSLISIDKDNKILLLISIFLMIMTSYYFSVVGIIAIIIYYIYQNFDKNFKEKIRIIVPIIIAILLAGILLIPTLDAILSNRLATNTTTNLLSLFLPNFNYSDVLYSSYALGLFSIVIISLIWLLIKKERNSRFLTISLLFLITFPIFRFIFNGGLYVRSKVLIPLIPLFILVLGIFLQDLFLKKVDIKKLIYGIVIILFFSFLDFNVIYIIDLVLTTLLIIIYSKFSSEKLIYIPLLLLFSISFVYTNINEHYITQDEYKSLSENNEIIKTKIEDDTFYRISDMNNTLYNVNYGDFYKTSIYSSTINNNYSNFYYYTLKMNNSNYNNLIIRNTSNIIFNRLMGVKYVYSDKVLGNGYELLNENIYENKYALSLGYATSNIYSEEQLNSLSYPYNLKYLLQGVVTSESLGDTEDIVEKIDIDLSDCLNTNKFVILDDYSFTIDLKENLDGKLLFIVIDGLEANNCSVGDIGIIINGIENTLNCKTWLYNNNNTTFSYVINEKNLKYLDVLIKKGEYNISNISFYTMNTKYLETYFDEMTNIRIKDNQITGNINIKNNGYMVLTLPYDKNYHIYVDEQEVNYEKVNTAFLGFKINKGNHNIKVVYKNKMIVFGKKASVLGLLLFVIYSLIINKKYDKL